MANEAVDMEEVAEVVAAVALGTLVACGLTKLAVVVGSRVAWGLTKLVSSSGLEDELDTDDSIPEMKLEANDGRLDRWHFPASGKLKMNTDGSVRNRQVGFGGVIRDENGSWIMGYYGRLKYYWSIEAELLAIHRGLQIIQGCNFGKIFEIESNCEPVANLINSKTHTKLVPIKEIVEECKVMLQKTGCTLKHIGNKANKVADEMAERGRVQDNGFVPFSSPPDQKIESLLVADVASARFVSYPGRDCQIPMRKNCGTSISYFAFIFLSLCGLAYYVFPAL